MYIYIKINYKKIDYIYIEMNYIYIYKNRLLYILLFPEPKTLLNKRNELIARCRHRAKFKL